MYCKYVYVSIMGIIILEELEKECKNSVLYNFSNNSLLGKYSFKYNYICIVFVLFLIVVFCVYFL